MRCASLVKRVVVGLAAATKEAQQIEEQVDEVQVQCQCTYDADFHQEAAIVLNFGIGGKALDLLGIIGSEYGEKDDTAHADKQIKTAATEEHIDQTCHEAATIVAGRRRDGAPRGRRCGRSAR